MNKTMTVYKVVRSSTSNSFLSCDRSEFSLRYRLGKQTVPTMGKIFVFDSLENAKIYPGYSGYIIKGIGVNPHRIKTSFRGF